MFSLPVHQAPVHMCVHACACMCVHMTVCVHICASVRMCALTCVSACTHKCTVHTHVSMCMCVQAHACACVHVCAVCACFRSLQPVGIFAANTGCVCAQRPSAPERQTPAPRAVRPQPWQRPSAFPIKQGCWPSFCHFCLKSALFHFHL